MMRLRFKKSLNRLKMMQKRVKILLKKLVLLKLNHQE